MGVRLANATDDAESIGATATQVAKVETNSDNNETLSFTRVLTVPAGTYRFIVRSLVNGHVSIFQGTSDLTNNGFIIESYP